MKNSIKTLFAAVLTLVVLTSAAFASTGVNSTNITTLNQVKNINKIVVNGNVKLLLIQAADESVKVYDSYYSKNALVQQENGELRISSFQKEPLTIAVYVRNLSTLIANDEATVKTYGKINFLSLDVVLSGYAKADINANTIGLTTTVKDNANLKLSGTTESHFAVLSAKANMSMDQFAAATSSINTSNVAIAKTVVTKKATLADLILVDELAK